MTKIINLTQHLGTPEQVNEGLFEPKDKKEIQVLLTFADVPEKEDIWNRAERLAEIAEENGAEKALIGGALWLMYPLAKCLKDCGITPVFSFSVRESMDVPQADGTVVKKAVFKHKCFFEA